MFRLITHFVVPGKVFLGCIIIKLVSFRFCDFKNPILWPKLSMGFPPVVSRPKSYWNKGRGSDRSSNLALSNAARLVFLAVLPGWQREFSTEAKNYSSDDSEKEPHWDVLLFIVDRNGLRRLRQTVLWNPQSIIFEYHILAAYKHYSLPTDYPVLAKGLCLRTKPLFDLTVVVF